MQNTILRITRSSRLGGVPQLMKYEPSVVRFTHYFYSINMIIEVELYLE